MPQEFSLDDVPDDGLNATADSIIDETPEPQQHAIDQAAADAQSDPDSVAPEAAETDILGVPWNPELHATSATTGRGVKTAKGVWRKRKGLKGTESRIGAGASSSAPKADPAEVARSNSELQARKGGEMMATLMIRISCGIGGESFIPKVIEAPGGIKFNEHEMLSGAFGDYFVATGKGDLPPGWALLGALCMYYLPRLQEPQVKARVGGIAGWFKDKTERAFIWWKYRKTTNRTDKDLARAAKERAGATNAEPVK